jgi:hypothetical protein
MKIMYTKLLTLFLTLQYLYENGASGRLLRERRQAGRRSSKRSASRAADDGNGTAEDNSAEEEEKEGLGPKYEPRGPSLEVIGSRRLSTTETWIETQKLTDPNGAANDEFGFSVSVSGAVLAVGARLDDDKGTDSGSFPSICLDIFLLFIYLSVYVYLFICQSFFLFYLP